MTKYFSRRAFQSLKPSSQTDILACSEIENTMTPTNTPTIEHVVMEMRDGVDDPKFRTISAQQKALIEDNPAHGPIWFSRLELPALPKADVVQSLLQAAKELGIGGESLIIPKLAPVRGEWVGHRRSVDRKATEPRIPEHRKYHVRISPSTTKAIYSLW